MKFYVVVVTATTLLLRWCAQVHNWASKKYLWEAELISRASYSHDYGEKYHFYCSDPGYQMQGHKDTVIYIL